MLAIDFDDTLNFSENNKDEFRPNIDLINIIKENDFFILTARKETPINIIRINDFIDEFGISPKMIIFTNNKEKGPFLKSLSESNDISILVDDKEYQRNSAQEHGFVGMHPDNFVAENNKKIEKLSRYNKLKEMWKEV